MSLTQTLLRSRAARRAHLAARRRPLPRAGQPDVGRPRGARAASSTSTARSTSRHPPVATLTLQPTSTWRGHRAGQYVQVGVEVDGARRTTRCFSISSPDSRPGDRFTITLRANPDGHRLAAPRRAGDARRRGAPVAGRGRLHAARPAARRTSLLISGGSGITPVMSMLRTLQRRTHRGRVTFLHYAQSPTHQIFADELDAIRPPATTSTCTCSTPSRATRRSRRA